ncbi:MAG: 3'-5' exonuclease [Treponema sp.]|nr:3'-5' exonuclease [Treponema sp.]
MQQNKKLCDYKKLYQLYEAGTVFTAFDTETTGLRPFDSTIIEIGAVKFDRNGEISTWSGLFNPGSPLPPQITQITHITDQMLTDKVPLSEKLCEFLEYLSDTVIVAHNAQFDIEFLNSECAKNGLKRTNNSFIDTLQFSKTSFPSLSSHKLEYLADYFSIDKGSSHRALDDARTCMHLFKKCMYPDGDNGQLFLF